MESDGVAEESEGAAEDGEAGVAGVVSAVEAVWSWGWAGAAALSVLVASAVEAVESAGRGTAKARGYWGAAEAADEDEGNWPSDWGRAARADWLVELW
jgi:hypothetical protein